jgi:hypothetical protein
MPYMLLLKVPEHAYHSHCLSNYTSVSWSCFFFSLVVGFPLLHAADGLV